MKAGLYYKYASGLAAFIKKRLSLFVLKYLFTWLLNLTLTKMSLAKRTFSEYSIASPARTRVSKTRRRSAPRAQLIPMGVVRPRIMQYPARNLMGRTSSTEVKSFDCDLAAAAGLVLIAAVAGTEPGAAYTGLTEINCIRQDATVAGRIGNKVVIKSLHLKVALNCAAAVQAITRCMVVYDRQPTGAFPAVTDILLEQPAGLAWPHGGLNISNKSRFAVIRDQFFPFDAAQGLVYSINWYMKGRWECEYGANGGNIGDFRTGAIYFICFHSFAVGGNGNIQAMSCRCRYYD